MKAPKKLNLFAKHCVHAANDGVTHEFLMGAALLAFEADGYEAWLSSEGVRFVMFAKDGKQQLHEVKIRPQKKNGTLKATFYTDNGKRFVAGDSVELPGINWATREGIEESITALSGFLTQVAHVASFGIEFIREVFANWNEIRAEAIEREQRGESKLTTLGHVSPASDIMRQDVKQPQKPKKSRTKAKPATSTHERTGETKEVDPVCAWIKERRKALGLTQVQLSELTGVKQPVIARNERGAVPTIPILRQLTKALGPYTLGE